MILILVAGIELAGELFAIVQITSVRRVINDVSTDDLKIWIPPSPLNRVFLCWRWNEGSHHQRQKGLLGSRRSRSRRRNPEAAKETKILEFNLNWISFDPIT